MVADYFSPPLSGVAMRKYIQLCHNEVRGEKKRAYLPRKRKKNEYLRRKHALLDERRRPPEPVRDLRRRFERRLVMDRDTGRAKGFGFVEMDNAGEAQAAIEAINGTKQGGRELVVNEARPREERSRREGGSRGGFGGGRRF